MKKKTLKQKSKSNNFFIEFYLLSSIIAKLIKNVYTNKKLTLWDFFLKCDVYYL